MKGFKRWASGDIFGFEGRSKPRVESGEEDGPIVPINSDFVVEYMMSREIRGRKPVMQFSNQVQWGEGTGAVRMKISPIGSFKVFIRKMQPDLEGCDTWVCKRIISYKEMVHSTPSFDEGVASSMMDLIERVESESFNAPDPEYNRIEGLTRRLARVASRKDVIPEIFIYKGVFQAKNPDNWLVVFECRGHGVEAPEHHRLEQFNIDMSYNRRTGMIRSIGQNFESHVKGHSIAPQPSEWDEYFSGSQPEEEIINAVASAFRTF